MVDEGHAPVAAVLVPTVKVVAGEDVDMLGMTEPFGQFIVDSVCGTARACFRPDVPFATRTRRLPRVA